MATADEQDPAGDRSDDERWTLEKRKLELEISNLSTPWWRTPSILAPMATICAALLGFAWAATTGFFDVSKRELDVRKREVEIDTRALVDRRDEQTRRFQAEAAQQRGEIKRLRREYDSVMGANQELGSETKRLLQDRRNQAAQFLAETTRLRRISEQRAEREKGLQGKAALWERQTKDLESKESMLNARLLELDRPILMHAEFDRPFLVDPTQRPTIKIEGVNLGALAGNVWCNLEGPADCLLASDNKTLNCTTTSVVSADFCTIEKWSANSLAVRFDGPRVKQMSVYVDTLAIYITRGDRRASNAQKLAIPETWRGSKK
jgi:hypothetical protein